MMGEEVGSILQSYFLHQLINLVPYAPDAGLVPHSKPGG